MSAVIASTVSDMEELFAAGGCGCATDQILYNLARRGPEHDLLPWLATRGLPAMAYGPVEQGRLLTAPALGKIGERIGATPAQVALAWVMHHDAVIAVPKASTVEHVRQNRALGRPEALEGRSRHTPQGFPAIVEPPPPRDALNRATLLE